MTALPFVQLVHVSVAAFAVASLLALLALTTLIIKSTIEWLEKKGPTRGFERSPDPAYHHGLLT